jgi:membrane-associated phospholipid phosphatase
MTHRIIRRTAAAAAALLALASAPCRAQSDSTRYTVDGASIPGQRVERDSRIGSLWPAAAAGLAAAALTDQRLAAFARTHRRPGLDRAADVLDPFGRAGTLVPALAASVVLTRLVRAPTLADAALRVALTYAVTDGVESVLKPLVGRHRPSDGGGAWRFRPFVNDADWHSLPSAHTVHAFALATGLAMEARSPWVAVPAYGVATLVGAQRVYTGAHWGSDVIASGVLAVALGRVVESALRHRGIPHLLPPVDGDLSR